MTRKTQLKSITQDVRITNSKRKNRISNFTDEDHSVMTEFYDSMEQDLSEKQLQKSLETMISKDADFYDPYTVLADIYEAQGKQVKARQLISRGFRRAMRRIVDSKGNFPKNLEWGWLENRHIIRIISQQAMDLWTLKDTESSLHLYRKLLKSNPNDNIGARYDILAILLNLRSTYQDEFRLKDNPEYMDAHVVSSWFEENSKKFPDEFDWWWKCVEPTKS